MKISLIIPVYNAMRHLDVCLSSVLAQTFQDYECILVDDGATDGSGEAIDAFAAEHPQFKTIHKANGGIASARNCGIDAAQGEWLLFMDDDDFLRPNLFQNVVLASEYGQRCGFQFDVIRYGFDGFLQDSDLGGGGRWNGDPVCHDSDFSFDDMTHILARRYFEGCMWRYAYRRATLGHIHFQHFLPGEDLVYQMLAFTESRGCVNFDAFGYCYRCWAESTTHQKINLSKFIDGKRYPVAMVDTLVKSGKQIDPWIYHWLIVKLTETVGAVYRLPRADRAAAWAAWYQNLALMRQYDVFKPWSTFVMGVCSTTRIKFLALLLCAFPYALKQRGINRGFLAKMLRRK